MNGVRELAALHRNAEAVSSAERTAWALDIQLLTEQLEQREAEMARLRTEASKRALELEHLLYCLLCDELTLNELEETVAWVAQAVQHGGVTMRCGSEALIRQLALRLRGPIDGEFEEAAHGG